VGPHDPALCAARLHYSSEAELVEAGMTSRLTVSKSPGQSGFDKLSLQSNKRKTKKMTE
jgi:hypothetical protein